jgi:hypothetical protein
VRAVRSTRTAAGTSSATTCAVPCCRLFNRPHEPNHRRAKPGTTRLQEASAANRTRFHLHDGPEQHKRDEAMTTSGDRSIANIGWLYEHDAAAV